jgi:SNW domain-containing protein 1
MDDGDDEEAAEHEMGKIQKNNRFGDALGRGTFKGAADAEVSSCASLSIRLRWGSQVNSDLAIQAREGPVQFEKDTGDVFNVDEFLSKVGEGSGSNKREYGLQESEERGSKRARVDEDED